ncbi:MAG: hypothetical protein M1305_04680, partial [Candidatus Marsarchaeota archaeon]|nr:hypothetical protein [Candidatus Marsarchaeota archaeon]
MADGVNFCQDILFEELARHDRGLLGAALSPFSPALHVVASLLQRVSILVYVAIPVLAAVVGYIITLLGFKALQLFVDPQNQPLVASVTSWFQNNQFALFVIAVIALTVWLLYAWTALQKDEGLMKRWAKPKEQPSRAERVFEAKEKLVKNPERIISRFASKGRTFVLLVDDVDYLDGYSFEFLLELYEQALQSMHWSFLLVLGYNPRNPTLSQNEKLAIRRELDHLQVSARGWTSVPLEPFGQEELRTWLWGHFRSSLMVQLSEELERTYPEAHDAPALMLSFFKMLDRRLGREKLLEGFHDETLKQEFELFLNRDRRVAQDIIHAIQQEDAGAGSVEMLRYLLAFKRTQVRVQHLKTIMARTAYPDVDRYEKGLLSEAVNLLRKIYVDGQTYYSFRHPYLRFMLDTGWREWRDNSETYFTEVFNGLHRQPIRRDYPELALGAAPSKLAIDVLSREGEYYYRYYGSSDAGYALRFFGLERGGALSKWMTLCEDAIAEEGNLWELLYWKSEAYTNPYRHWSGRIYPDRSSAPELVLTAGRLYWMIGKWQTAEQIWAHDWPRIVDNLPPAPSAELAQRLQEANANIQTALAEMLYHVAQPGGWDRAMTLCLGLRDRPNQDSSLHTADLILALIRHYRSVGVGNELAPYTFLHSPVLLDPLIKAAFDEQWADEVCRLRAIHVVAESLWQMLTAATILPRPLDLDTVKQIEVRSELLEQFFSVLQAEQSSLESILARLTSRSPKPVLMSEGRIKEGELLFCQGAFLLMRARHYWFTACHGFGRYSTIITRKRRSEAKQRFQTYYAIANQLNDFCKAGLLDHKPPPRFAKLMYELEEIDRRWPEGRDAEMLEQERNARGITQQLCQAGWQEIIDQAKERLRMAEVVWRRLGHQQGIAAVAFVRAIAEYESLGNVEGWDRPIWVDDLERFVRFSSGELGYQLDALRSHLIVNRWASSHDLYRSLLELQAADAWVASDRMKLPEALNGELSFRIGALIGNMERSPIDEDQAFAAFDRAARILEQLGSSPPYISQHDITERRMDTHWWLAELSRRLAHRTTDAPERERLLGRTVSECNYVIGRSKRHGSYLDLQNRARLVRGQVWDEQGKTFEAFLEIERAVQYFANGNDLFNHMQALLALATIAIYRTADEKRWQECVSKCENEYLPALVQDSRLCLKQKASLGATHRLVLYRACHLLGSRTRGAGGRGEALFWLDSAFDLLESLGLYGMAILLDNDIRPLYETPRDDDVLERHKKRVINAAQRLDPARERIQPALIRPILARYAHLRFSDSQYAQTKRECIELARHALQSEPPEIVAAIELLRRARKLIDQSNPEDLDVDVLQELRTAHYRNNSPSEARSVEEALSSIQSIIQSRDFLALAKHYQATGFDYVWALRIAAQASPPNEYSLNAQALLGQVPVPVVEANRGERAAQSGLEDTLMTKPIDEFSPTDCGALLWHFERGIR